MATKEELKTKLEEKFPGSVKKLSKESLDRLLDKLAGKNPDQPIDELIEAIEKSPFDVDYYFSAQKAEDDKKRTDEARKKQYEAEKAKKEGQQPNEGNPEPDSGKDLAKMISDAVAAAVGPLASQLGVYQQKDQRSEFTSQLKSAGIPEKFANYVNFGEGFNAETELNRIKEDWKEISGQQITNQLPGTPPAQGFKQNVDPKDKEVSPEVKAYAEKLKAQNNPATTIN